MSPADNPRRRMNDANDDALRELIRDAVRDAMPAHERLTDDELSAVRLLIRRETQRVEFRRAVIEKTTLGLLWAGIVAAGLLVREYMVAHGMWRP
jgi:hypothetical protein